MLSLQTSTSGLRLRGGARDTSRNVKLLESKRSVHVCPTKGAHMYVSWVTKSSALPMCILAPELEVIDLKVSYIYIYIYTCACM